MSKIHASPVIPDNVIYQATKYNNTYEFPFEQDFDPVRSTRWMQQNWTLSITMSLMYVLGIYLGKYWMQRTEKQWSLKGPLILWNAALAVFSIMGSLRMSPEFFHVLSAHGFEYSMCNASFAAGVSGFWTELFAYSKVVEFGDTIFMILRRRPVIFLHWYHHITVLMYTWHAYKDHTAAGRWFIWMNYTVHAFMYTYYTSRAIGWPKRLPKWVPMSITVMQLTQMVVGCLIAVNSYYLKTHGGQCQQTFENLAFSAAIYFTYFLLFADFFVKAYLAKGGKHNKKVVEGEDVNAAKKVQ